MDGFGAVLLLKHLNDSKLGVFLTDDPIEAGAASFNEAVKAKQFIEATKKNILTGLSPSFRHKQINQKIKVITFSKEETDEIRANGPKLGALFGPGPLYLASAARAVREILAGRQTIVNNFWVPVPQNQRKKGATGPLLGNHLSFLFYLLSNADLTSTDRSVRSINSQMVNQVKLGIPKSYASLMQYLRRIPYALYHHYTRGKKGASLSSFLFTVAEEHPKELMTFHGLKVVEALSFPPNIYPPGLTFAFMAFGGYLHILLQYYDEVISEVEITKLEAIMRQELVLPDCS